LSPRNFDSLSSTLTKSTILTSYNALLPITTNKSSGIPYTLSGNTSTIGRYISKALVLLKQKKPPLRSLKKSRKPIVLSQRDPITTLTPTKSPHTVNHPRMRTHLTLATCHKKLKQESLLPSRNSPVALVPQVPKEPHPIRQVRFLEAPNFQYQKKVHFLLHPCPKAKQRKNLYPRPLPALRDPRKPLQYPPQPSPRHHLYQKETPREYHRRSLLTGHTQEEQAHHRDHLVPQHHPHPQLSWQETSRLPNSWEVPLIPMMGTQQRPKPFGTPWPTIIQ